MTRYCWDFRGRLAAGTAEHFRHHLDDFVTREGLAGCETGVLEIDPRHVAAWCLAPTGHHATIERALKPHRQED